MRAQRVLGDFVCHVVREKGGFVYMAFFSRFETPEPEVMRQFAINGGDPEGKSVAIIPAEELPDPYWHDAHSALRQCQQSVFAIIRQEVRSGRIVPC